MISSSSNILYPKSQSVVPIRLAFDIAPYQLSAAEREMIETAMHPVSLMTVKAASRAADVLVSERIPDDVRSWPNLQLIQLLSAGTDHLEGHRVWESDIAVATASGIGHVSIAQYCLAMILNHYHSLPRAMQFGQTRAWPNRLDLASRSLRGETACIYGYGSIGRECGRLLRCVGVDVLAVNRSGRPSRDEDYNAWPGTGDPEGAIPVAWYSRDRLADAVAKSQILVVTAPRSASTRNSLDASMLVRMPRGALVVIVSRGGIVDENALAGALHSGQLAGAVVDTYVKEPPPADHPLFGLSNAILTPHISGVFDDYMGRVWPLLIQNVQRLREGRRPLNLVHDRYASKEGALIR